MKKTFLLLLLPFAFVCAKAQTASLEKSTTSSDKKFQFGIGIGIGLLTDEPSVLNASFELQGEGKVANGLSLYSNLSYNRVFEFAGEGGGGYASLLAGPRAWFSPKVFVGVGGGIAYFTGDGESDVIFNYNPHIGLNTNTGQFTLGYSGLTQGGYNTGFIQLKGIFKLK